MHLGSARRRAWVRCSRSSRPGAAALRPRTSPGSTRSTEARGPDPARRTSRGFGWPAERSWEQAEPAGHSRCWPAC
jgi:hypothetical protein